MTRVFSKIIRQTALALAVFGLGWAAAPIDASANPLNQWRLSCGADKGSVVKKRKTWTFKTSANYCSGGTFNQRAEIYTKDFPNNKAGAYLFSTTFRMTSLRNQQFSIFSVHDGRDGCAPPLQLFIDANSTMRIASDIKTGPGESCIYAPIGKQSRARIKRDGTAHELKVLVDFNGQGGFNTAVWLDGSLQIKGTYTPSSRPDTLLSKRFYFKHGVYSKNVFQYEMVSEGMRVKKVKTH